MQLERQLEKALDLAKRKGADQTELFYFESEDTIVQFKADVLKTTQIKHTSGLGIRVIKDKRIGFSSMTGLLTENNNLEETVENAINVSKFGEKIDFEFPENFLKQQRGIQPALIYHPAIVSLSISEIVKRGNYLIDILKSKEPDCKFDINFKKSVIQVRLVNSNGLDAGYNKTIFSESMVAAFIEEGSFLFIYEEQAGCQLISSEAEEKIVDTLIDKVKKAKKKTNITTKKYPVLFSPKSLPALIAGLELGCNGKLVEKGASLLVGKIGEKLLSEQFTLIDDATQEYKLSSIPFDGEGIICKPLVLFEQGILKNFIFDLQTASKMGCLSTGHGIRSYDSLPTPGYTNLIIASGTKSLSKILADVDECIFVDQVLGAGQSNLLAGEFSLNLDLGFKIEKGECVGRVKDNMVAGNIYDVFNKIEALSLETETIGSFTSPYILFKEVSIASAQ